MAAGRKTGGRKAGTPNKKTSEVKAALAVAFDSLGGVTALTEWAREEPTEFYKLWAKMLPAELNANVKLETVGKIVLTMPKDGREADADSD